MGLGEAWWFLDRVPQRGGESLLELLDRSRLRYRHPTYGAIYVMDDVGSRREASLEFVCSEWVAPRGLTMQLWLDEDTDVVLAVDAGGTCVTFGLDGLTRGEATTVVSSVLLCACITDETRALVVDRSLPETGDELRNAAASRSLTDQRERDLVMEVAPDSTRQIYLSTASWLRDFH